MKHFDSCLNWNWHWNWNTQTLSVSPESRFQTPDSRLTHRPNFCQDFAFHQRNYQDLIARKIEHHDAYAGLGTASITCRQVLEEMQRHRSSSPSIDVQLMALMVYQSYQRCIFESYLSLFVHWRSCTGNSGNDGHWTLDWTLDTDTDSEDSGLWTRLWTLTLKWALTWHWLWRFCFCHSFGSSRRQWSLKH